MSERGLFHISLAGKCRLLFGLAVALIIAAALFVPWYSLETLVHHLNVQRARHMATLARARMDPAGSNWMHQQELLEEWWSNNARSLKLPDVTPTLVPLVQTAPADPAYITVQRLQVPFRRARRALQGLGPLIPQPMELQVGLILWKLVPPGVHEEVDRGMRHLLDQRVLRAILPEAPLDEFQQECVRQMRANEALNEMTQTERRDGEPTYRFVLAVRGEERTSTRRPLVGLIDVALPVSGADQTLLWTRVVIVVAGMLAGFLAILVFYLITQKLILAPVRELRVLTERVTEGDLTARSAIDTGDEFEELSEAFNQMLTQLELSRDELETINRSLDTRLGELAETNVTLFESNRLKSEFLANVSHELRTPLTSIIGFADLLRDTTQANGAIDTTRAARYANNILTSGRMLLDIINDLLDLAKIEAGKVELHRSTFSLAEVCEDLSDFMRPLVDKKDLTFTMALDEHLPMMNSDAGKIRQVLYNLLSNAVKYTPAGGTIRLEASPVELAEPRLGAEPRPSGSGTSRSGEYRIVRLVVADTGPGIAREHQERIFEKFRQLDASVTREHSGTGLGLAISREICTMLGGTIRLESRLGEGARFIVELPVECPDSARRPLPALT